MVLVSQSGSGSGEPEWVKTERMRVRATTVFKGIGIAFLLNTELYFSVLNNDTMELHLLLQE